MTYETTDTNRSHGNTPAEIVVYDPDKPYQELVLVHDEPVWMAWDMAKRKFLEAKFNHSGSAATRRAYARDLKLFEDWLHGIGINYWEMTPGYAVEWVNWMSTEGKAGRDGQSGQPLARATVNRRIAAVAGFYDYVILKEITRLPDGRYISLWDACHPQQPGLRNPFSVVDRYQVEPFSRSRFPATDELKSILDEINTDCLQGKRDFALIYTYATTCRRFSEIVNLRWGDIELLDSGDAVFAYRYKGGKPRKAIIKRMAWAAILAYLRADGRDPAQMQPGDYVFIPLYPDRGGGLGNIDTDASTNRPISHSTAASILKKYGRRAGVDREKCHLHALRHAGARLRLEQMRERGSIDLGEICDLLGHSSLAVTQIYLENAHTDPQDPGGDAAAAALMPKRKRGRPKKQPPEQLELPETK